MSYFYENFNNNFFLISSLNCHIKLQESNLMYFQDEIVHLLFLQIETLEAKVLMCFKMFEDYLLDVNYLPRITSLSHFSLHFIFTLMTLNFHKFLEV